MKLQGLNVVRIIEYVLLSEFDPSTLSKKVNERLDKGWELYGSPVVTTTEVNPKEQLIIFAQAMVGGV
jgi:hypothetical protein